jgi:hypothetical protein
MLTILLIKHVYFLTVHFTTNATSAIHLHSFTLCLSAILPSCPLFHFDIKDDQILCVIIN